MQSIFGHNLSYACACVWVSVFSVFQKILGHIQMLLKSEHDSNTFYWWVLKWPDGSALHVFNGICNRKCFGTLWRAHNLFILLVLFLTINATLYTHYRQQYRGYTCESVAINCAISKGARLVHQVIWMVCVSMRFPFEYAAQKNPDEKESRRTVISKWS